MPYGIYENIECDTGKHSRFNAQKHQEELLDYFLNKSKYKGIVAYHKLGSGKSCSSILIADQMIRTAKVKKVYVMTPGSLRQNFIEEYCEKCGYKPEYLKKYYTFITTNYSVGERLPDLNNSLVVIDEVHNLINGVKNQSKHATFIYNALMNSNCRILALSGTPVFNYIWEWPFLGNLLKPGTFPQLIKQNELDTEAFMTKFIIDSEGNIKPKDLKMFRIQLRGIISFFPGVSGGYYPDVIYEPPIQVRMTPIQDENYWNVASWENDIRIKGPPAKNLLRTDSTDYKRKMEEFIMCSKYIMSRYFSNFYYPDDYRSTTNPETRDAVHHIGKVLVYKYKPTGETNYSKKYFVNKFYDGELEKNKIKRVDFEKEFAKGKSMNDVISKIVKKVEKRVKKYIITDYEMQNIGWVDKMLFLDHKLADVYSRKMVAVITNVLVNWKAKHVVFTFFKTKAGVNMLHALLKMCGIKTEIYSGDITDPMRKKILKNFNAEKNRYGDRIKILLVTEAGAEGINILEAQHMHILESSTREMKIQQVIGRVVRYKSHMVEGRVPMPKNEQVVHIWRYWSTSDPEPYTLKRSYKDSDGKTKNSEKVIVDKTCVDEILYKQGIVAVNTIQSFLDLLKKSSVTSYDKEQGKGSKLKDYGLLPVSPELDEAYEISKKRYLNNTEKIREKSSVNIDKLLEDLGKSTDEAKGDGDVA